MPVHSSFILFSASNPPKNNVSEGTIPPGTLQNPAETGFYYLQSRYYDPARGRFISPDSYVSTGQGILGNNMFAYCNNNPVSFVDSSGNLPKRNNTVFINDSGQVNADLETTDFVESPDDRSGFHLTPFNSPKLLVATHIGQLGTYTELKKVTAGTGLEVHHLIEQRFYRAAGMEHFLQNPNNTPCVVLDRSSHQAITRMVRVDFPYGRTSYVNMTAPGVQEYFLNLYGNKRDWVNYIVSFFE